MQQSFQQVSCLSHVVFCSYWRPWLKSLLIFSPKYDSLEGISLSRVETFEGKKEKHIPRDKGQRGSWINIESTWSQVSAGSSWALFDSCSSHCVCVCDSFCISHTWCDECLGKGVTKGRVLSKDSLMNFISIDKGMLFFKKTKQCYHQGFNTH